MFRILSFLVLLLPATAAAQSLLKPVLELADQQYVDRKRLDPYEMLLAGLQQVGLEVSEVVVDDFEAPKRLRVSVAGRQQSFELRTVRSMQDLLTAVAPIWSFIDRALAHPESRKKAQYALVNGMLGTLDPHTVLFEPQQYDEMRIATQGEFGGLGVAIAIRERMLTVMSPIEGTPASRAGLRANDHILRIDDYSTTNMALDAAVSLMRGIPGTKVELLISRDGWAEPRKVPLTREVIHIVAVTGEALGGGIGYVKVRSFQQDTARMLEAQLSSLAKGSGGKLKGLVLDFRDNPGGLLDQAIALADRFVATGLIVATQGGRGSERKMASGPGTDLDTPIIVLINGGSASASEIVAGALQQNGRALVLGERSFGKGSVQVLNDIQGGAALKMTIAEYFLAQDKRIQTSGLTPDVELMDGSISKERVDLVEDLRVREDDLDHRLDGGAKPKTEERAALRVLHLTPPQPEPKPGAPVPQEEPKAADDFAVQLAKRILEKAGAAKRGDALKAATPILQQAQTQEDAAIAKALTAENVDWRPGPAAAGGNIDVRLEVTSPQPAVVGGTLALKGTVTNTGSQPLYRVLGVTDSETDMFRNLELPFGYLAPKASKSWTVTVNVPEWGIDSANEITLRVKDGAESIDRSVKAVAEIEAYAMPRFDVTVRWGKSVGPEGVELDIEVQNLGGPAREVTVLLSGTGKTPVSIENGTKEVGFLDSGAKAKASLSAALKDGSQSGELAVMVRDLGSGADARRTMRVPLKTTPGLELSRFAPPVLEVRPAAYVTAAETVGLSGEVEDESGAADLFVLVNDKKVHYESLRSAAAKNGAVRLPFDIAVPLRPGANTIVVVARKDFDVLAYRSLRVVRDPIAKPVPRKNEALLAPKEGQKNAKRAVADASSKARIDSRPGAPLALRIPLTLLVLDFEAKGKVPADLPGMVTTQVLSQLDQVDKLQAKGMADVSATLDAQHKKELLGCDDTRCYAEIGGALGTQAILYGSLGVMGSRYAIGLSVVDSATAEVRGRVSLLVPADPDKLADALPELVQKVVNRLNEMR